MEKYNLLDKANTEDIEVVREYAKARTELKALEMRIEYLEELVDENDELRKAVWTTREGRCIPIKDLEDDHLKNIVVHLREQFGHNTRISKEYKERFGDLKLTEAIKTE